MENKQITILGIGNSLYSDEGIGIHALPPLEELFGNDEHVELVEGSTGGMSLLGIVEDSEYLLIIDAINAGKPGGTIIELQGEEIPAYYGIKMSIHQLGFQEVLHAAKFRERYPENIVMIGMQPSSLQLGVELSETNKARLSELIHSIQTTVAKWKNDWI